MTVSKMSRASSLDSRFFRPTKKTDRYRDVVRFPGFGSDGRSKKSITRHLKQGCQMVYVFSNQKSKLC
jgi:hypothetical protein